MTTVRIVTSRFGRRAGLLLAWILLLATIRAGVDPETDIYWSIREGIDILRGGPLVHPDHWSWLAPEHRFVPNSPLWQYLLAISWQLAGRSGVLAMAVLSITLCLTVLAMVARRFDAGTLPTVLTLCLLSLLANGAFTNRAALPAFVLFLSGMVAQSALVERLPRIGVVGTALRVGVVAVASSFAGMWMHSSWTAWAPASAAGVAYLVVRARNARVPARATLFAAASLGYAAGALAGPLHADAWPQAVWVAESCRGIVVEWNSAWSLGTYWRLLWVGAVVLSAWLAYRELRTPAKENAPLRSLLAIGALAGSVAGASAMRFLILGLVASAPVLAARITEALRRGRWQRLRARLGERGSRRYWTVIAWLLVPVLAPFAVISAANAYPGLREPAFAKLPAGCHLFSDDNTSGPVILVRPDVRVWIDGRLDMYGRARSLRALRYLDATEQGALVPAGTDCVLVKRRDSGAWLPLDHALRSSGQWTLKAVPGSRLHLWLPRRA